MSIDIVKIIDDVAAEWQVGGFDENGIYGQFALEVTKRAIAALRERDEFICDRCQLRQDHKHPVDHEF